MKYHFPSSQKKNFKLLSKLASFVKFLWLQGVSRQLFKTQSHKKVYMSKVNSKFPNYFQPVQLFLSMPSCLPSFISKGLRKGENQEWYTISQQSHLFTKYCNQCSEKPLCCQIKLAFWTNDGNGFQSEFIFEQNISDKNHFQDFVRVNIVRYVCQKE